MTVVQRMLLLVGAAIVGVAGLVWLGQNRMGEVYDKANYGNVNSVPSILILDEAGTSFGRLRVRLYRHVLNSDSAKMAEIETKIKEAQDGLSAALKKYEVDGCLGATCISDDKDKQLLADDIAAYKEYLPGIQKVLDLSRQNKNEQARDMLTQFTEQAERLNAGLQAHMEYNSRLAKKGADDAVAAKAEAASVFYIIGAIILLAIALLGWFITRNLLRQLGGEPGFVVELANKIAVGDLSTQIDLKAGDTSSVMAAMQNMMISIRTVADLANKIAAGDLSAQADLKAGETNGMLIAMKNMTLAIQALVNDTNMLSVAAVEGKLQIRADSGKHQGDFRKIVQGVNDTMDGIVLPLNEAIEVLALVEQGDLTRTLKGDYKGQLGDFKNTINNTVAKLSQTIAEVVSAADQLGSASGQVSATSQSLSQASSEQAASVEETSASIEQMASSIDQNTENAKVTDGMAAKASKEAVEGGVAVKQTVEAMKDIAGKIGIIDDIAYQTNMLALNAAIEAARAGDHGKGFAVVAAEVRKLAERSQIAAQEIGELAETSVKTAESAGQLLDAIVPSIAKTSDLVQEIAAASQEQSAGVIQVNVAMNQMNQITQQNASASEELAATAEEMTSQAEQLQELISFFKIAGNDSAFACAVPKGSIKAVKAKTALQVSHNSADADVDLNKFVRF